MNKKVLITVSGGISNAFADEGVGIVIIDLDDANDTDPNELDPIHGEFLPLLKLAQASTVWPVSDNGRKNDAYYMEPSDAGIDQWALIPAALGSNHVD